MKSLKMLALASLILIGGLFTASAFAQSNPQPLDPGAFFSQVVDAMKGFGGMPWLMKISTIVLLVIASMKVSFLDDLIWNKLGPSLQVWIAPILGLIAGIIGISSNGSPFSFAKLFAYMSAGAGAIILHQILDSVKGLPGIGGIWVSLIAAIESGLGGNPQSPVSPGSIPVHNS